ncbi:MAG TPA: HEAT repeat domain-containing protein [Terriglobia bacterium]|nr:HEAT repeat domain-containing protein [Terriglobia bacterium]
MNCMEIDENLALYLYGELASESRQAFETHLGGCEDCRTRLEETRRLHAVLSGRPSPEPSPELLVHCRTALEQALDRELAGVSWKSMWAQWTASLGSISRLPIAAALTLVALGFSLGWTLRNRVPGVRAITSEQSVGSLGDADMSNLKINNISQVTPSAKTGDVRITVNAERQMTLEGSLDDPHIRQVLIDAVTGYDNPGIRHDSMEVLRRHANNPNVRTALLYAFQNDPNPGVRLDALQTVLGMEWNPEIQQALLNSLDHERNQGVRVAAIDVLADHADLAALPALRRLAADDTNRYVRMKAAGAIRKLQGD